MSLISVPSDAAALGERLHDALAVTPALVGDVISRTCSRFCSQREPARTERVAQLIRLGAWTDAALALIELELPHWRVRRLAYDDGEWYCALSRERELPDWLDQCVETRHADLALAILGALVEAQQQGADAPRTSIPRASQDASSLYEPLLSDNFG